MPPEDSNDERTISERIAPVMEATAERIHYAEGRRANYVTMGGALLAAAITIFTFAWSAIDLLVLRWSATFGAATMFIVGLATIWVFGQQTNRYPWTSATKTWKWFYRDALPAWNNFKIPWTSYFFWKKTGERVRGEYDRQLPEFKSRMRRVSDDAESTTQDLEQLYVLHINEGYKNIHLTHLRTLFNRGIYLILISIAAGALFGWYLQFDAMKVREFTRHDAGLLQTLKIKLVVSPLDTEAKFIGRATVANGGGVAVTLGDLVAHDRDGWSLPLSSVTYSSRPVEVPPKGEVTFDFAFDAPSDVAARIDVLEVETK